MNLRSRGLMVLTSITLVLLTLYAVKPWTGNQGSAVSETRNWGHVEIWISYPNGTLVYIEYTCEDEIIGYGENGDPILCEVEDSIVILNRTVTHGDPKTEATGQSQATIVYGRGTWHTTANVWVTRQISFGYTYSSPPKVTLGPCLAHGESGHIEDPNNIYQGIGITTTYFYYRAESNEQGWYGTNFIAIGT